MSQEFDPDFFEETKPLTLTEEGISRVTRLVRRLEELAQQKAVLNRQMEELNAEIDRVETDVLPAAMDEIGMSEFTMTDGSKIVVQLITRASIPKDKEDAAFAWLRSHNADSLIKREVSLSFGKGQDKRAVEIISSLRKMGMDPKDKQAVAWNTLTAWVKEQLANGADLPRDLLGIWNGRRVKITQAQ